MGSRVKQAVHVPLVTLLFRQMNELRLDIVADERQTGVTTQDVSGLTQASGRGRRGRSTASVS